MIFTEEICKFLATLIHQYEAELFPDSKKKDARSTQEQAWQTVHTELMEEFPDSSITLAQCKSKWSMLKQDSKADAQKEKR
jgi:hypothetical protein